MMKPAQAHPPSDADQAPERAPHMAGSAPTPAPRVIWALAAGLGLFILAVGLVWGGDQPGSSRATAATPSDAAQPAAPTFPVVIRQPAGPRLIATGLTNFLGQPAMASCSSCHTTTKPNLDARATADLDQFHQGLKYVHGNLSCLSCHNSKDYETLRLADGRAVEFQSSMNLCSQCHGPQRRDYDRGLHGGMNGHWDLTRGGRTRNTCINCHDPHSPAFPQVMPVLAPRDRVSVPVKKPHGNERAPLASASTPAHP